MNDWDIAETCPCCLATVWQAPGHRLVDDPRGTTLHSCDFQDEPGMEGPRYIAGELHEDVRRS